jgi:signal transduction histidine kinase
MIKGGVKMNIQYLKWAILLLPSVTIGIWEYVRHEYLEHILPLGFGNFIASVIVFLVLIAVTFHLFSNMEKNIMQLQKERTIKAQLEEREQMAHTLHDGIAQSLFLLMVKLEKNKLDEAKIILHDVNAFVRESISNLRLPIKSAPESWDIYFEEKVRSMSRDFKIHFSFNWNIPPTHLSTIEVAQLAQIINECLQNACKHSKAKYVHLKSWVDLKNGWTILIEDDGIGPSLLNHKILHQVHDDLLESSKFGILMMEQRCSTMGWSFRIFENGQGTTVEVKKQ